jgi:MFS family permease
LAKPFLFFANHWLVVFAVRFADRVGKGIRTPARDALISDSIDPAKKGYGFGFHRGMDRLGAAFGPLLALLVLHLTEGNLRIVFLLSVVPAAIAVFIIGKVKEIAPVKEVVEKLRGEQESLGRAFFLFVASIVVFTLGNSSNAFLILKARDVGLSLTGIPLIWLTYNLVCSISSPMLGRLSDRVGRRPVILVSFLVYGAIYAALGFSSTLTQVWFLFACYGFYYGLSEGAFRAYIADLVKSEKRATAYGLFNAAIGITLVPASVIFGALWDTFSSRVAFLTAAALALVAAVVFLGTQARSQSA